MRKKLRKEKIKNTLRYQFSLWVVLVFLSTAIGFSEIYPNANSTSSQIHPLIKHKNENLRSTIMSLPQVPKKRVCSGNFKNEGDGRVISLQAEENRIDSASECRCSSDKIFFGIEVAFAPSGFFYSGGCQILGEKTQNSKIQVISFSESEAKQPKSFGLFDKNDPGLSLE